MHALQHAQVLCMPFEFSIAWHGMHGMGSAAHMCCVLLCNMQNAQHICMLHTAAQRSTAQHSAAQRSTAQHSAAQRSSGNTGMVYILSASAALKVLS